ncbi:MAG: hypothetical protein COA52_08980 [Hyphomicrobiales bacterium]|nr:MAG: hypothetical protein COA52_08980 [Hyphomicrobiales bacterium]
MGVDRGNGASAYPMANRACGANTMMNGFTEVPAGKSVAAHYHNCEESILVVKGNAIAEIDGKEQQLKVGEVLFIPPNVPHRIRNAAKKGNLRLFWTYASGFATRTVVETGRTQTIFDEQRAGVSEHEEPPKTTKPAIEEPIAEETAKANEDALSAMEEELAAAISVQVDEISAYETANQPDAEQALADEEPETPSEASDETEAPDGVSDEAPDASEDAKPES